MPDPNDIPRRRGVRVLDLTQAASEVSRLVHEAHDLNLPVNPASAPAATAWSAGRSEPQKPSPKQATTSGPAA
jgi:hypothetical protein